MKISRRNKANPDFSLAAMTDVILLLLIFFMITSAMTNQSTIDVQLPKDSEGTPRHTNPLTVSIKPNGTYFVDDKPTDKNQIENVIVKNLQGTSNPIFTIRADKNSLHKDVVFVMEIAERHKFNIAIATTTQEE